MSVPRPGLFISPRSIITEILRNMRESAVDLLSYRLVPSTYYVLLHQSDSQVLDPIRFRVIAEAQKALDAELKRLNHTGPLKELLRGHVPYERAGLHWRVDLLADPDHQTQAGQCMVRSELALPESDPSIAGAPTRFTTTTSTFEAVVASGDSPIPPAPTPPDRAGALAEIQYAGTGGTQSFVMTGTELWVVSQGGREEDLQLRPDLYPGVRLLIRKDSRTGAFLLQNQSDETVTAGGKKLARGVEALLARSAIILLPGGGRLEFKAVG